MDGSLASARVNLALKRSVYLAKSFGQPFRSPVVFEPVQKVIQYGRPGVLAKSASFVVSRSAESLREMFAESRLSLYKRLVGVSEDDDCGCEGNNDG